MKQHHPIPGNQVAVHVFVREENGRRNVIQQLQEKNINVVQLHKVTSIVFSFRMIYLCFYFPLIDQTLPNPIKFSFRKKKKILVTQL